MKLARRCLRSRSHVLALVATLALAPACAGTKGAKGASAQPEAAVDPEEHAIFTGEGGAGSVADFVAAAADAALVAVGELHYHPVGSRIELEVLEAMAGQGPVALAMEFFERDTQADLDAYLAGTIDQATFVARTRQGEKYPATHGPLIEFCKARGIPVIAANAPRRLVTGYRKSGLAYDAYLASLPEAERALLPRSTTIRGDDFERRFLEFMGPERGPAFLKSMVLWNDAMAESIADFRAARPDHRVLLVVGVFHVAGKIGVITSYGERRPEEKSAVLVMEAVEGAKALGFEADDRGEGDLVVKLRPGE